MSLKHINKQWQTGKNKAIVWSVNAAVCVIALQVLILKQKTFNIYFLTKFFSDDAILHCLFKQ